MIEIQAEMAAKVHYEISTNFIKDSLCIHILYLMSHCLYFLVVIWCCTVGDNDKRKDSL